MCEVAERLEKRGIEKGLAKGLAKGRIEGESALADAIIRIRKGESEEKLISVGFASQTIALAKSLA